MSDAARPIHLPGANALDTVRQRAQAALDAWAHEWVSARAGQEQKITVVGIDTVLDDAPAVADYEALRTEIGCMWFRFGDTDRATFARAVLGSDLMLGARCADDWVAKVVERARATCMRALCMALVGAPPGDESSIRVTPIPAELFAFGSGAVRLSCDSLGLHAIVDGGVWRGVPPASRPASTGRTSFVPLDRAVQEARMRLEVVLGSVEIELPTLLGLQRGDVLRLPQRLEQAIAVLCDGKPLGRAALGELRGCKAVQFVVRHT